MGVKNNFSQAVSELIGISRTAEPEPEREALTVEKEAEAVVDAAEEEDMEQDSVEAEVKESTGKTILVSQASNPKERIMAMLAQQQHQQQQAQSQDAQEQTPPEPKDAQEQQPQSHVYQSEFASQQDKETAGVTTIAKGTVIIGEINAMGDVELLGSVKGRVSSQGDIKVIGKVIGDLAGRDIELTACAVQGNIYATGMVNVDGDSVVIGDVKGENFCLDGKIKGNVTVEKEAKFQTKAILAGNVTTASIAMSQGAKIQGEVNIPLSEKETNMTFDVDIKI